MILEGGLVGLFLKRMYNALWKIVLLIIRLTYCPVKLARDD